MRPSNRDQSEADTELDQQQPPPVVRDQQLQPEPNPDPYAGQDTPDPRYPPGLTPIQTPDLASELFESDTSGLTPVTEESIGKGTEKDEAVQATSKSA